jgi:TonB family protein
MAVFRGWLLQSGCEIHDSLTISACYPLSDQRAHANMLMRRFASCFAALIGALLLLSTLADHFPKNGVEPVAPADSDQHADDVTHQDIDPWASVVTLPSRPPGPDYTGSTGEEPQSLSGIAEGAAPSISSPDANTVSTTGETDQPWAAVVASSEPAKVILPIEATGDESETAVQVGANAPHPPQRLPRPIKAQSAPKQATRGQITSRPAHWKPMGLAPSDKPSSANTYDNRVWAALARHKPKASQNGSAIVSFVIGTSGELRSVQVNRTSGNPRLDQMALATVRNAAPFPLPPEKRSGAPRSYSIRIYFP